MRSSRLFWHTHTQHTKNGNIHTEKEKKEKKGNGVTSFKFDYIHPIHLKWQWMAVESFDSVETQNLFEVAWKLFRQRMKEWKRARERESEWDKENEKRESFGLRKKTEHHELMILTKTVHKMRIIIVHIP